MSNDDEIMKPDHCVKLPKIPWYFCQDIPGFGQHPGKY